MDGLHNQMAVGATISEGRYSNPPGERALRPRSSIHIYFHIPLVFLDCLFVSTVGCIHTLEKSCLQTSWVECFEARYPGYDTSLHHQRRFDHSKYTTGSFTMADIRFDL